MPKEPRKAFWQAFRASPNGINVDVSDLHARINDTFRGKPWLHFIQHQPATFSPGYEMNHISNETAIEVTARCP